MTPHNERNNKNSVLSRGSRRNTQSFKTKGADTTKLLTLNTHSLQEADYEQKLLWFLDGVLKEQPDVLALQEVSQSADAPPADRGLLKGLFVCQGQEPVIRADNHALRVAAGLRKAGISCSWFWQPVKIGYGKYDEGMALFVLNQEIAEADSFYISRCQEYDNWKTRKVLGIRGSRRRDWFYTIHMGWWQDEEEPFSVQWQRLEQQLLLKKREARIWLMGDFNSPAGLKGQGYDCVRSCGWQDTYKLAWECDCGATVEGVIDGWEGLKGGQIPGLGMRIDYIWCSTSTPVRSSKVIFNGKNWPKISDHFGVLVEIEDHG